MSSSSAETERLRRFWDAGATHYDRAIAFVDRRWLRASRRWVGARATGETLEVAIGTGLNLPHYGADVTLTGVEFSPAMLRLARQRAATLGREVTWVEADAAALPFAEASFDTVVATFALCCVLDERAVLAELARVLRPGGRLLLADHVEARGPVLRWLQGVADALTVRGQGEHWRRRPRLLLDDAGLQLVEAQRLTMGAIERVHAIKPGGRDD